MDPKSNTAKDPIIRDLEWIIADANVDERTVLDSENTLSDSASTRYIRVFKLWVCRRFL